MRGRRAAGRLAPGPRTGPGGGTVVLPTLRAMSGPSLAAPVVATVIGGTGVVSIVLGFVWDRSFDAGVAVALGVLLLAFAFVFLTVERTGRWGTVGVQAIGAGIGLLVGYAALRGLTMWDPMTCAGIGLAAAVVTALTIVARRVGTRTEGEA